MISTTIWQLALVLLTKLKKLYPEPVTLKRLMQVALKKFENQKLSLSNGIELIVPNNVYEDAESAEFISKR